MTLVVSLGLYNFFYDQPDKLPAAVASLVEAGYTTLVREIVSSSRELGSARVLEVNRQKRSVKSRWLDAAEAKPILADVGKVYAKHDTFVSFSWDRLDAIGAYEVHPLALTLDGPTAPPPEGIELPGVSERLHTADLKASLRNWGARDPQARGATAFHKLAQKHRLIVHRA